MKLSTLIKKLLKSKKMKVLIIILAALLILSCIYEYNVVEKLRTSITKAEYLNLLKNAKYGMIAILVVSISLLISVLCV